MLARKYEKGNRVVIRPAVGESAAPNPAIEAYSGQTGEVMDYYWISPRPGEVFYIYSVRTDGPQNKELVLHEDEIESF